VLVPCYFLGGEVGSRKILLKGVMDEGSKSKGRLPTQLEHAENGGARRKAKKSSTNESTCGTVGYKERIEGLGTTVCP